MDLWTEHVWNVRVRFIPIKFGRIYRLLFPHLLITASDSIDLTPDDPTTGFVMNLIWSMI
jgi:hypothetical protein